MPFCFERLKAKEYKLEGQEGEEEDGRAFGDRGWSEQE